MINTKFNVDAQKETGPDAKSFEDKMGSKDFERLGVQVKNDLEEEKWKKPAAGVAAADRVSRPLSRACVSV